jgi:hypothetical protein
MKICPTDTDRELFEKTCHTEIGECQISGKSNPAARLPRTEENLDRIWLTNWKSNFQALSEMVMKIPFFLHFTAAEDR